MQKICSVKISVGNYEALQCLEEEKNEAEVVSSHQRKKIGFEAKKKAPPDD